MTVGELAEHWHNQNINGNGNDAWNGAFGAMVTQAGNGGKIAGYPATPVKWSTGQYRVTTDSTGGNAYHNNVAASIAAYIWKRVS